MHDLQAGGWPGTVQRMQRLSDAEKVIWVFANCKGSELGNVSNIKGAKSQAS